MFNFVKKIFRSAAIANTGVYAVLKWKMAFHDVSRGHGARYYDAAFWEEVVALFKTKWREYEPASEDPEQVFEKRMDVYLEFLKYTILEKSKKHLTTSELEGVGEFIANASVLDLGHAILTDPERVAPIFDLLPRPWLETAGLTAEEFDKCYFQRTGKHRSLD
jgi:hypothetical protein